VGMKVRNIYAGRASFITNDEIPVGIHASFVLNTVGVHIGRSNHTDTIRDACDRGRSSCCKRTRTEVSDSSSYKARDSLYWGIR
jgi:hypothetical protein